MKRIETVSILVAVSILFVLSILPAIGVKNCSNLFSSAHSLDYGLRADGDPAPPFPPKPSSGIRNSESVVIADGDPAPPFPKPPLPPSPSLAGTAVSVADGEGLLASV